MDFVEKYWPSLVGILVMAIVVPVLWPSSDPPPPPPPMGIQAEERSEEPEVGISRSIAPEDRLPEGVSKSDVDLTSIGQPQRTQMVETVVAFPIEPAAEEMKTYDQDDPEVKAALQEVDIQIYQADWCGVCERARLFFETNNLPYRGHDIESDSSIKERMRRLSGGTSVPVILIDGEVLRGFSEASVESALTAAVKRRIEG